MGRAVSFPGVTTHLADRSVQQFVNSRTNKAIRFQVETVNYNGMELDIISIAAHQTRPIFLKKDFGRLKKDVVYVRRGSSTAEAGPEEIAEMGRADAMATAVSVPSIALEFANPQKRERWGTTATMVCTHLIDPPKPASETPKQKSAVELALDKAVYSWQRLPPLSATFQEMYPTREEWMEYMKENALFAGVSYWAQNIGISNASNVRVEIRIAKKDGVIIESGYKRPRKPRGRLDIRADFREPPTIWVQDEGNDHIMLLELGTLQPKAEFWVEGDFIVTASSNCEIPVRVRIFADDLPNPLESVLTLKVKVESRVYTTEDMIAATKNS